MSSDTLQIDHQLLQQLQQDPRYSYAIEEKKPSLFSELFSRLTDWLGGHLEMNNTFYRPVFYSLCTLAVLVLIWWLVRSGLMHRLLMRQKDEPVSMEEAEANIHSTDFAAEISRALAVADYTRATRLLYLQTLKLLSDARRIDWQPEKTPAQYAAEEGSMAFRQLTNHFMRVRYGGYEADRLLFETMQSLQSAITKGGSL